MHEAATTRAIAGVWAEVLDIDLNEITAEDDFLGIGGDSIRAVEAAARIEQAGYVIPLVQLLDGTPLAQIDAGAQCARVAYAEQEAPSGGVPLTPQQHMFFEQALPEPQFWSTLAVLQAPEFLDTVLLRRAGEAVYNHHDGLRLRFVRRGNSWQQFHAPSDEALAFNTTDIGGLPHAKQRQLLDQTLLSMRNHINLESGPVFEMTVLQRGRDAAPWVVFVTHHLVVDFLALRILLQDFERACVELRASNEANLPPKTSSFQAWSERLSEHAQSASAAAEIPFWLNVFTRSIPPLPVDFPNGLNTLLSERTARLLIPRAESQSLARHFWRKRSVELVDAMHAALGLAFAEWSGEDATAVRVTGHGRNRYFETIDVSRTVGWLTLDYPLLIGLSERQDPLDLVRSIREQRKRIPRDGLDYAVLRYLHLDPQIRHAITQASPCEWSFNYQGRMPLEFGLKYFRPMTDVRFPSVDRGGIRDFVLQVNASVERDGIRVSCRYSSDLHRPATMDRFLASYRNALAKLADA